MWLFFVATGFEIFYEKWQLKDTIKNQKYIF